MKATKFKDSSEYSFFLYSGVRDLDVAFFKAYSTQCNNVSDRPIYAAG